MRERNYFQREDGTPLELSWKNRRVKELALMEDLVPQLKKIAKGRDINGLAAYE